MQTISQFSSNFHGFSQISAPFRAPKYTPKSSKNRFWELLATILHRFGAARSNLDGFWTPWARFFIDLAFIFEWIERGFCKQSLDEQYALVAALNMARCFHIAFSRCHLVRRGAHRAWNPSQSDSKSMRKKRLIFSCFFANLYFLL